MHSHKPLDLVVLALGTNDLKRRFALEPGDIAYNLRILVQDIRRFSLSCDHSPSILVLGLPSLFSTPLAKKWGFPEDVSTRAKRTTLLIQAIAEDADVHFLDISSVPVSPLDGIHFSSNAQPELARLMATKIVSLFRTTFAAR